VGEVNLVDAAKEIVGGIREVKVIEKEFVVKKVVGEMREIPPLSPNMGKSSRKLVLTNPFMR